MDLNTWVSIGSLIVVLVGLYTIVTTSTGSLRVELKGDIAKLDERLSGQIRSLDERFSGEIRGLDERLSGEIRGLDERLSGQIRSLDDRLSGQIRGLDDRVTGRLGAVGDHVARLDDRVFALAVGLKPLLEQAAPVDRPAAPV